MVAKEVTNHQHIKITIVQSAPISKDPTSDQHTQPGISTIVPFYFLWLIMRSNNHSFMFTVLCLLVYKMMFIIFTSSACLSLDMFDLYSDIMDIYTMKSLFIKKPNFQHLSSITNVNIVINFERYWWINTVLYDHLIYVTKLLEITQNLS